MKPVLLFADADDVLLSLHRRFFSDHGYHVETAKNGLECIAKLRQFWPEVLVLDLDLPWGGGEGVLALLREDVDVSVTTVILTGTSAYATSARNYPAFAFLPKPFPLQALIEKLRTTEDFDLPAVRSGSDRS